jgi:metal-dependent amidase/aminoacylase/carboxypeptidase family protein
VSPLDTAVLSVGSIHGGSNLSPNVMPAEMEITGTMRAFDKAVMAIIDQRLPALANAMATAVGCTVDVTMRWGTTPLVNAAEQTEQCVAAATALVGPASVNPNATASTGGEDFAFMMEQRPGAMILIGNGVNSDGSAHQVHTPHYNFNDEIIPHGVAFWAQIVQNELAQ